MEIVRAKNSHLNEIYMLVCELENEELDIAKFTEIFFENLQDKNIYYFVAEDQGHAIGFISVYVHRLLHHAADVAEIQELVVTKDYQKMGIGRILFAKAKELATDLNCMKLEVCCNKSRCGSHLFYEKQNMARSHFKFTLLLDKK